MTNGKSYGLGQMIPEEFDGTWDELIARDDWKEFVKEYQITEENIYYIKAGFNKTNSTQEDVDSEYLMPFAPFKGEKLKDLKPKYVIYLSKQDWLEKWPTVAAYVKRYMDRMKEGQATVDDVKNILQTIE